MVRCLECGADIAELAQVCGRCGVWAPVEYRLYVPQDRAADAAYDVGEGPAAAAIDVGMGHQRPESAPDPDVDAAGLAGWVESRKFSTTRRRPGYDLEEVDTFLSAIRDTFLGIREPSLTPDEIRARQFSTTRLRPGYDQEEVDAFLDEAELKLAAQVRAGDGAPARSQPSPAEDAEAEALRLRRLECEPESAEAARMCVRCGAPVPPDPEDTVQTECPYCGASLRPHPFRRHYWQRLTHPQVMEHRKELPRDMFIVTAFILGVAGLIFLFATFHWTATGG